MRLQSKMRSFDGTLKYQFAVPVKRDLAGKLDRPRDVGIEAAFLDLTKRIADKPRYVLCLSSMAGCVFQCSMCRNMLGSFYGPLTPNQIQEEVDMTLRQDGNLGKIRAEGAVEYAFMGIGEPLWCGNVVKYIESHDPVVKDTKFSISSIGAKGYVDRLINADLPFPVRLELSFHFPTDNLRRQWIQVKTLYSDAPELTISRMLDDAARYMQKSSGKVTLNYALIDGINNSDRDIDTIAEVLKNRMGFYVKVMEANHTSAFTASWRNESHPFGLDLQSRGKFYTDIEVFRDKLLERGIEATAFRSKGKDIGAGCGMMASGH